MKEIESTTELVEQMLSRAVKFLEIFKRACIKTLRLEDKLALLQIAMLNFNENERKMLFELYENIEKFYDHVARAMKRNMLRRYYRCKICGQSFPYHTSTFTLVYHCYFNHTKIKAVPKEHQTDGLPVVGGYGPYCEVCDVPYHPDSEHHTEHFEIIWQGS